MIDAANNLNKSIKKSKFLDYTEHLAVYIQNAMLNNIIL